MSRIASLDLLDPTFRARLDRVLVTCAKELPTLHVFETIRPPSRQEELYQRGRDPKAADFGRTVTRARAYQSAHQFGLAVDLVFKDSKGKWTWSEPFKGAWDKLHEIARAEGLEPLSFERPHLQLAGFNWRKLTRGPADDAGWVAWLARGRKAKAA